MEKKPIQKMKQALIALGAMVLGFVLMHLTGHCTFMHHDH